MELAELLSFLSKLDAAAIHYDLKAVRAGAVMVLLAVPGQRWEVEFFADGEVQVEFFTSDGVIEGPMAIERLFRDFSD